MQARSPSWRGLFNPFLFDPFSIHRKSVLGPNVYSVESHFHIVKLLLCDMELTVAARCFYCLFALSVVCNIGQFLVSNYSGSRDGPAVRRALADEGATKKVDHVHIPPGARKVFIDLGANDGSSTAYFLEKNTAAGNIATQGGEQDSFLYGLGASRDWEVIAVEANVNHSRPLNALRDRALRNNMVRNFTVLAGTAISKFSGQVNFIIDNPVSGSAGATLMKESTSAVGPQFSIPAIGIGELFHTFGIQHSDFVILKMDIEGYEFELLRYVLTHGVHSRIDVLAVEFHDVNYWVFGKSDEIRLKYQALHKCIDWMAEDIRGMKMLKWGR